MKIKTIKDSHGFAGTFLIPLVETYAKSVVPVTFEDVTVSSAVFHGKKDSHYIMEKGANIYIFIGLGKDTDYKTVKTIFRRISVKQKEHFRKETALIIPEHFNENDVEAAVSGLLLGTYDLGHFKQPTDRHAFLDEDFTLQLASDTDYAEVGEKALLIAQTQLDIFSLVDLPPNVVTPKYLADWARKYSISHGFSTEILDRKAAKEAGLEAFLAVAQGSVAEPQFIILNYAPENSDSKTKHVGLVGKGITFDTGGLNIKTAAMVHMKCDMAGGAAVLGAVQLASALKLNVKLTAIVPCCENAVDSKSFMPGDVIQSYSGHSIEIIDTDAEGRLILADALSYLIKNFNPEIIIDIATLTGSSVSTFGYECAAMFSNNTQIIENMTTSGDAIGERIWRLPLWDSYKPDIESEIADVRNYSGKPVAGAITAAKFLEYFTKEHKAWAHLDIAGVAFGDDEFAKSKHATAYGVHLLTKFIENL